ncbi:beta-ketoacyl synthase N-terminal-like domain-containing protein [Actinosynnema sp. NPDC047251]|uniref:Polyketide synthase n=1 Tax=Saccharothrix espanaensis (strain ATCC 51144 / DSM 44229 / JCM 9112 / NBRC 15066 / NRRL 15764) TaxID=1179773 RepID=K0K0I9_SACES|nr:beta-ketoacyl synthase N-terminal-like domain-containing protein [Saccharothrix espanaensis]CCH31866.1 Polyketide synthase [Saccharothrix espanaensis DSM 44229]
MTAVTPVAIVGMAVLFPGAPDLDSFWRNISGGVDAITDVPADRWDDEFHDPAQRRADRVYTRRGGFVEASVDVAAFGVMPASVPGTEPDQLIALQVAADAVADAGGDTALPADRRRAGVILGRGGYLTPGLVRLDQRVRSANQVVRTLRELVPELDDERLERVRAAFAAQLGPEAPESAIGLVPNLAASRVANRLDLRGPAYTVDAACASSLVAVDHAVRELDSGRCDVVLAGGVHHCHDITLWSVFSQLGALSRSGRIRPFHRDADGVLIGEGTGVVVLKRLADAERDGDRVYAVIAGTGVAGDGRSASLLNPDPGGQANAVRQAWTAAGLDPRAPDALGLLEAHGTATPAGDAAELRTLAEVFGPATGPRAALGSVKSMIGHTMPAAGVAGLVKAALAVHHGVLPPTLHCDDPHPALAGTRFSTPDRARPWDRPDSGAPRRAGVNAFGFGGINAHVVLTEPATRTAPVVVREPTRVLRLAAATTADLLAALTDSPQGLDERADVREPVRLGVVDPTPRKLALARKAVAKGVPWRGRGDVWFSPEPLGGRTAFLFPGLEAEFEPEVADVAARFGLPWSGGQVRVGDVGRHGAAVFQVGRLLDAALRRLGVRPDAVAGHSVGEWTAMAAGGIHAADEVDAFLAAFDPESLHVPGLAFAVIGTSAEKVTAVLAEHPNVVLSHDNAPNQAMVCGPEPEVDEVVRRFRAEAVIARVLPFRSGFHTPMLAPYLDPIRDAAQRYGLHRPTTPVWSATTAAPFPADPAGVRALFVRHLLEPVRFRPLVRALHAAGFRTFVQLGAGQLGSLVGDTLAGEEHLVVSAHGGLAQLRRVVTALWVHGRPADAGPLLPPRRSTRTRLDLGSALVSLPAAERIVLTSAPDASTWPADDPVAAELSALLRDTAGLAADLITARTTAPTTAPTTARTTVPSRQAPPPLVPAQAPPDAPQVLRVGLEEFPYLRDHCFFRQRPGWPDAADSWPVVPATTVIAHLTAIAERTAPGTRATAVHDVRLTKWITATPGADIPVTTVHRSPTEVEVGLTGFSQAVVTLAGRYPPAPPPWPVDEPERTPDLPARGLYDERWMFHGPLFQGVTELTAIGDRHVRGTLAALPTPGALLDNVGQLLGYWVMAVLPDRTTVFPVRLDRIAFHGPQPAAHHELHCHVKITAVTDATVTADVQLHHEGRVWAEITGWTDRRFDTDAGIRAVDRFPGSHTLSTPHDEGWAVVHERWPDLATRELVMRNMLGGAERTAYDTCPPNVKRRWLLGRIAAKDAARALLWREGAGEVYPAEIAVDDPPRLRGVHGRDVSGVLVDLAHCAEVGVAIARRGPCGIDVREAAPDARHDAALAAVAKLAGAPGRVVADDGDRLRVAAGGREHTVGVRALANPPGLPAREYVVAWTPAEQPGEGS